ncbi:glycosyltransferase family 2 protein [Rhodosalinus sp. K401]|uniref:glycosyltransferase family 2 protein n=1 Tax=Rhodosalinus sp. K401 TaxID=3239195 RepID=UPI0035238EA5
MVTVSVIIPTYNRAHCVCEAIDSVLSQDPSADEIIVVDDGSTDATLDVLSGYGDGITVLRQENAGAASARNAGIRHAQGEWITFLDSDDTWYPGRLEVLHRDLANAAPDTVGHTGDLLFTGSGPDKRLFEIRMWNFPKHRASRENNFLPRALLGISPITTALRRDVVIKAGGFNDALRIYEDMALFSIAALSGPWLITGDVLGEGRRLADDTDALTFIEVKHPIENAIAKVKLTSTLLEQKLTPTQRTMAKKANSGALLRLAAAEAQENTGSHRQTVIASARQHPSAFKGWLKALPPLLFGCVGYRFVLRRSNGFSRT